MPLSAFHPTVSRWFRDTLGEPTTAQSMGWEAIRGRRNTLIAAPTGSGKTLAAFLNSIDDLLKEGLEHDGLPDEVRVIYVSPLKALSTDIHKNLAEPRRGVRKVAETMGLVDAPKITAAVRTGDTPQSERAAMLRKPPHILVTTPESFYLLLTAARSREMLRTVRTVIVDEIHAVIDSRRGAHLALSLERLEHVAHTPPLRIGLSATQKPIEEVARFLVGASRIDEHGVSDCTVVDQGHRRTVDLALEIPQSPLEAVMSHEVWEEYYDRLAQLIGEHKTTLVFVNTRRMAERMTMHLSKRLGRDAVTAHHGSLSREKRLDAEERLREGKLEALVATASLELGIDIGHVDLACQIGSPRWISTFLQRMGRSGHTVHGTPKGRLFPLTRDDLLECAALLRSVKNGELDRLIMLDKPLDVLAQQIVAESACEDWPEVELFGLVRRAYPYRKLERHEFDEVVQMAAHGYTTRRGRRGALLHYDGVNGRIRGRRGARLTAITAGGAIPDNADFRVVLEPESTFIGTVNEDFVVESIAGDIFQLGNSSWRILKVEPGVVRVADAQGEPPNIPFWFGEAPGRSAELSTSVSELRREIDLRLGQPDEAVRWLIDEIDIPQPSAAQIVRYLSDTKHLLGVLPTQHTLVLERFFDESGGMQLVLHAPFGSRVNRAWGLALRKRFCRQFNFELQAAATENGLLLSLGPQHSFPLDDVFRYLHPNTVEDILVQALLDAPVFQTRWRWNATISLAVLRNRGGRKVPPQIQRMEADDLMAAAFPDAAACFENIEGDREIPDHPLVRQTVGDCLDEAMDLAHLRTILSDVYAGEIACVSRDTPEPSPLCHEILNAMPYAFLDDAPLEERRSRAVYTRRAFEPSSANELGALDTDAIARVADEAWPDVRDADELHDALLTAGFLTQVEGVNARGESWALHLEELVATGRATRVMIRGAGEKRMLWVAAERLVEIVTVWGGGRREEGGGTVRIEPLMEPSTDGADRGCEREDAIRELLRGRLSVVGPTTAQTLASSLGIQEGDAQTALHALEGEGVVLRGYFTPGRAADEAADNAEHREWCDRRLLARIHRYTLNRLRAEIEPVSPADFMRYLFTWQHVDPEHRMSGVDGLAAIVQQLDAYELAAGAWEADVLSARMNDYDPLMLDTLCLTGRVTWGRLSPPTRPGSGPSTTGPVRSTPIALFLRENADQWHALAPESGDISLSTYAQEVIAALDRRGASFFQELVAESDLLATQVEHALGELVAMGLVASDSFAGLRALLTPSDKRKPLRTGRRRGTTAPFGIESAGRWSKTGGQADRRTGGQEQPIGDREAVVEHQAWTLLRRYGVVFRRLLTRETNLAPWRELTMVYRRLEARGEIRGGRFVSGMSGEQFALPEAVGQLRKVRRFERTGQLIGISGADLLNLTGIITPGDRVHALATNWLLYQDGVPLAAKEGGESRKLAEYDDNLARDVERALVRRRWPPALRVYLGKAG
jgi:ATP-dependent Lhr-like helicase